MKAKDRTENYFGDSGNYICIIKYNLWDRLKFV